MAILVDTSFTGSADYQTRDESGVEKTITQSHSRSSEYRAGTGRRKRPSIPDETSYDYRQEKVIGPFGSGSWFASKTNNLTWSGALPKFLTTSLQGGLQVPLSWDTDLRALARIEALASLNRKDLDLGTAWAERGKTAQMVGDIATKTVRTVRAARKGRGREILDIWGLNHRGARGKGFVDSYLTYHYGVKPFLYDVAGAASSLARMPPGRWRVTAKGKSGYDRQKKTQVGLGGFYPYLCDSQVRQSCRTKVSAVMKELSRSQDLQWALGLDDPLSTAWELTPWSFVLDWMVPIGDWLAAQNSKKYYDGWLVVESQFRKERCTYHGSSGVVNGSIKCETTLHGGFYSKLDIRRSVTAGPPMLAIPVKDPRSLDHMAKALSLLASTLAQGGIPRHVRY